MITPSGTKEIVEANKDLSQLLNLQDHNAKIVFYVAMAFVHLFSALLYQISSLETEIHNLRGVIAK